MSYWQIEPFTDQSSVTGSHPTVRFQTLFNEKSKKKRKNLKIIENLNNVEKKSKKNGKI
jgi:hypothetical protein